jgi:hypothetical protein
MCNRTFTTQSALSRHTKHRCKAGQAPAAPVKSQADLAREIEEMRETVAELRATCAGGSVQNIINNSQQVISLPTTNVYINIFGREDIGHIGPPQIQELLDHVLETTNDPSDGAMKAVTRAAMMICGDPAHPANLTCYVPNRRAADAVRVKSASGDWVTRSLADVNVPLVQRAASLLFTNQPFENAGKYGDLLKALRDHENNQTVVEKTKKDIRNVLLRNKDLVKQAFGAAP